MSQILDQVEQLRRQAIDLLLTERNLIDEKLVGFGYDGAGEIKNRKPNTCGRCGQEGHTVRTCRIPKEADA